VKPAPPPEGRGFSSSTNYDKALYTANNMTLRELVRSAYGLKDYQLQTPAWMETTRFNISAKVPAGAAREQVNGMLQKLLVERFQMEVRREEKDLPAYTLVVAKSGPKLKEVAPEEPKPADSATDGSSQGPRIGMGPGGMGRPGSSGPPMKDKDGYPIPAKGDWASTSSNGETKLVADTQSIDKLVQFLSRFLGQEVVDKTGLTGKYTFRMAFSGEHAPIPGFGRPAAPPSNPDTASDPGGPNVFRALQDQLGLKLETTKVKMPFLIIDKAEKTPIEN
jgi:uncharacterized protein (TIGR03435 family)